MAAACATVEAWLKAAAGPRPAGNQQETPAPQLGPRLLVISGIAGVGKSRLLTEVIDRLTAAHAVRCLTLQGYHGSGALRLLNELLLTSSGLDSVTDFSQMSPSALDAALTAKLQQRIAADLAAAPHLLVRLEDIQWLADCTSVLREAFRQVDQPQRLILLATCRGEYPLAQGALGEIETELIELQPLDRLDGRELLRQLLPAAKTRSRASATLHRHSAGLPLYYLNWAGLPGQIAPEDSPAGATEPELPIPATLAELISTRLAADAGLRRKLLEAMARQAQGAAGGMPGCLGELASPQAQTGALAPELNHQLVFETAYALLDAGERRELHTQALACIEPRLQTGSALERELLPVCCYHLERLERHAELHQRCCDMLLLQLTLPAEQRGEWEHWRERAEKTWRLSGHARRRSPWLRRVDGYVQWYAGELRAALGTFRGALRLSALGKSASEADAYILRGRLCGDIGNCFMQLGRLKRAAPWFECALAELRQAGAEGPYGVTLANSGILKHRQGHLDQARQFYEAAFEIASRYNNLRTQANVLSYLGALYNDQQQSSIAQEHYSQCLAIFRRLNDVKREAMILVEMGTTYSGQGEKKRAEQMFSSCLALTSALSDTSSVSVARVNLGVMYKNQGKLAKAAELLEEVVLTGGDKQVMYKGVALAELGSVLALQKQPAHALTALNSAIKLLQNTGQQLYEAVAHCYLATVNQQLEQKLKARHELALAEHLHKCLGSPLDADLYPALQRTRRELDLEQ